VGQHVDGEVGRHQPGPCAFAHRRDVGPPLVDELRGCPARAFGDLPLGELVGRHPGQPTGEDVGGDGDEMGEDATDGPLGGRRHGLVELVVGPEPIADCLP